MTKTEALFDLEDVQKQSVVSQTGQTYLQFRKTLAPNYRRVTLELFGGWAVLLVLALGLGLARTDSWAMGLVTAVGGGALTGYTIAYLHLFFHEAAHFNLAADRAQSDRLANLFLGPLLLSCVEFYRCIHFAHHRLLGTNGDTENSYFQPLSPRFLLYSVSGQRVAQVLLSRTRTQSVFIAQQDRAKHRRFFLMGAAGHAGVVLASLAAQSWILAVGWSLGVFCFTPFFGAVRQLLEHRRTGVGLKDFSTENQGKFTRTFTPDLFGLTFGAAGFNRHLLHHWDPTLSYTCLEAVEHFVLTTPLRAGYLASRKSYLAVFRELYVDAKPHKIDATLLKLRRHSS